MNEKLKPRTLSSCNCKCPRCGSTDAIDWDGWDIEGEVVTNKAICNNCGCNFMEVCQIVYNYTEVQ